MQSTLRHGRQKQQQLLLQCSSCWKGGRHVCYVGTHVSEEVVRLSAAVPRAVPAIAAPLTPVMEK